MGVPFHQKHATNRYDFKLGLILAVLAFVILKVGDVSADEYTANEQYEVYKVYEGLQKQIKPQQTYGQLNNNNHNRRLPVYQPPSFSITPSSRGEHHYGVQHQEQRQEQQHQSQPRILEIENTKYSIWSQNMSYLSSTGYNALGMTPLYNLTNKVIDLFVDKDEPIPPGRRLQFYITRYHRNC